MPDQVQIPRRRVLGLVSATVLVPLVAATPTATPAPLRQQVASFTVAYESDLRSSLNALYTSKGRCGDEKGTVDTLATATSDTAFRARVVRTPRRGGYSYGILPGKGRELQPGPALALRFVSTRTTNLQELQPIDDTDPGCSEGAVFRPSPGNGSVTTACTVKGSLVFTEDRGRISAAFRSARGRDACDPDGYPGRTNELRLRGKARPADLGRRKRNVITASAKKSYVMPPDAEDVSDRRQADTATWKLTLQRTSAWKTYVK